MIRFFIAGLAVLMVVLLFLHWLSRTSPRNIKRTLAVLLVILLAGLTVVFVLSGRFAFAVPTVIGALAIGMRTWQAWRWWRKLGGLFGAVGLQGGGSAGQSSQVASDWLAMELDHDSGRMDGEIRKGNFKGWRLSDLARQDMAKLYTELEASDADGLRLYESYLERNLGNDWQQQLGLDGQAAAGGGFAGSMSQDEALRILGLEADAGEAEIQAAHRELLSKLHPDRGGSDYLAAKINQAKDLLLPK